MNLLENFCKLKGFYLKKRKPSTVQPYEPDYGIYLSILKVRVIKPKNQTVFVVGLGGRIKMYIIFTLVAAAQLQNVSRSSALSQSFYLLPFSGKIQNKIFRLKSLIIRYGP